MVGAEVSWSMVEAPNAAAIIKVRDTEAEEVGTKDCLG